MEQPAPPAPAASAPAPAPPTSTPPSPRSRTKLILLSAFLLLPFVLAVLLIFHKGAPLSTSTLKLTSMPRGGFSRTVMLRVENKSGNALLLWEPCRVERKETGRIIVAGTQQRVMTLRGTKTPKAAGSMLLVELTGTNRGPWRVLVPVTRYGLLARLEALFHQPIGNFAMKSATLKNLLRNSKTWIASEWFDGESADGSYPFAKPATPFAPPYAMVNPILARTNSVIPTNAFPAFFQRQIESQNLINLLHVFYSRFQRWPTNVSELASYAKSAGQPVLASRFDDATFNAGADGRLALSYDQGHSSMTLSPSGVPSPVPPPPAPAYSMVAPDPRTLPQRPERLPPSLPGRQPLPQRPIPGSPIRPDDSIQTMMFIFRNFQAHYKHWPANMAEVKAFANDTANFQPEFPETYDNPLFDNAVFTTSPDGGLRINYQNGSMNLAKPK